MDKKLIERYGEDILCYRLRSARHKKRMQYEDFHKRLRRLDREDDELQTKKRNLGWEPLVPPVQQGWERYFVLRHDVAVSKHAAFFQNILDKINTHQWCWRRQFLVKYRRYGRKKYKVRTQGLLIPTERHFAKLNFSPEEKQFFHEEFFREQWSIEPVKRYVFNEPWRFVLRIRPYMITKVQIRDPDIESRLREISNYIYGHNYFEVIPNLQYCHRRSRRMKNENIYYRNPIKNKTIQQILDATKEEII